MDDYLFWYVDLSGRGNDYILEAEDARKLLRDRLLDLDMSQEDYSDQVDEIDSFIEDHIDGSEWLQENGFKIVCLSRQIVRRMKGRR